MLDLRDSPAEEAFRARLREWIGATLPDELRGYGGSAGRYRGDALRAWSRALSTAGYAGLTWPAEYGGGGQPASRQAIFLEELARAEAPAHMGVIGLGMIGPTIIAHGSAEQKRRYLPPVLSGEEIWCQGFSEPDAGSDLSGVRTRARLEGGEFVLDGQKVWSSYAHIADRCGLLARASGRAGERDGLVFALLDMRAPGVEVRPLRQLTGEPEFNEIFLTGARVPLSDVVGDVGTGWTIAMTTLMHERGTTGFALVAGLEIAVRRLVALAAERGATALQRDAIAREWADVQALRMVAYRSLSSVTSGESPGPEGSILKLQWSEANQRVTKLALDLLGGDARLAGADAPLDAYWQHQQQRSRGNTIGAGTSEILRNIIAERVLGLPRSR